MRWYSSPKSSGLHPPAHSRTPPQVAQGQRSLSPLGGIGQLSAAGVALASAPPGLEQPAALTAATSPAGDWAGGAGIASTRRSRGPERGCFPRYPCDDGSEAATCVVGLFRGWRRNSCPRAHAGERPPHYQLPRRTTVWIASAPRGVSWRDTEPNGSQRGGASRAGPPLPTLWSSSGKDPGGRTAQGSRPGGAASV